MLVITSVYSLLSFWVWSHVSGGVDRCFVWCWQWWSLLFDSDHKSSCHSCFHRSNIVFSPSHLVLWSMVNQWWKVRLYDKSLSQGVGRLSYRDFCNIKKGLHQTVVPWSWWRKTSHSSVFNVSEGATVMFFYDLRTFWFHVWSLFIIMSYSHSTTWLFIQWDNSLIPSFTRWDLFFLCDHVGYSVSSVTRASPFPSNLCDKI